MASTGGSFTENVNKSGVRFWTPWLTVVGVVADVKHYSLERDVRPGVYLPLPRIVLTTMSFAIKAAGDPAALIPAACAAVRDKRQRFRGQLAARAPRLPCRPDDFPARRVVSRPRPGHWLENQRQALWSAAPAAAGITRNLREPLICSRSGLRWLTARPPRRSP